MSDRRGVRPISLIWRWVRRALVVLVLAAMQVMLVLAAGTFASSPAAAITAALVASAALVLAWTWVRGRGRRDDGGRRDAGHRFGLAGAALGVATILSLLVVMPTAPVAVKPPPGALQLPDGTFLAVRSMPAVEAHAGDDARAQIPLVAVHGGPGVPWTADEERVLERLATDRDVVVYDQVGTGDSARLDDPSGYTFERAVRDLEAVVESTGADRVTLLGFSWGAPVALAFAVAHPDRVDRLVFLSPGAVPWHGVSQPPGSPQSRLSPGDLAALYARAIEPRNLFAYSMTLIDTELAHRFMPDAEADARYRELYLGAAAGLVCDGHAPPDAPERLGHFANHGPGVERAPRTGVTATSLDRLRGHPALIVRPECDYLDAGIADEYARELPLARVTDVADSGHALLEEQPDEVIAAIRAFLDEPAPATHVAPGR